MGIFERLFPKREGLKGATSYFKALTAYQPVYTTWNGKLYESELVRAAIDARARHIGKLKIVTSGPVSDKLAKQLKKKPNGFMTWYQFLYRTSTILDMQNTAFIIPVLNPRTNTIIGYYPALPSNVELVEDATGATWLKYRFSNGNVGYMEYERCGIMTKFQYENDFFGSSNNALNETMSLMHIRNQGIKVAVKNSGTYRFMARVTNFTKPEDLKKEREKFSERNLAEDSNAGGLLLFPNTYSDIQQLKNTPYTVDAEQTRQINTNVFNYFGVNEDILQNKAIGDAWNAFYEGAIEPFAIQFSEVVTFMSCTDAQIESGALIMATSNRLQYMSNADKLKVSAQMADRGIMTRNEIREIWNLEPIPGGDIATIRGEYYMLDANGNPIKEDENEQDD